MFPFPCAIQALHHHKQPRHRPDPGQNLEGHPDIVARGKPSPRSLSVRQDRTCPSVNRESHGYTLRHHK